MRLCISQIGKFCLCWQRLMDRTKCHSLSFSWFYVKQESMEKDKYWVFRDDFEIWYAFLLFVFEEFYSKFDKSTSILDFS